MPRGRGAWHGGSVAIAIDPADLKEAPTTI
jgi:hypothetical protein